MRCHLFARRKRKVNSIFYMKQYIGHARHEGAYYENTLSLYRYLVEDLNYLIIEGDVVFTLDCIPVLHHGVNMRGYIGGQETILDITKHNYDDLSAYSLIFNREVSLTLVEDFIKFGSRHGVCIMLDLTFQKYSINQLRQLYRLVCKYKMEGNTIWGDANILKLSFIDRNLVYQVGGSWGRKLLLKSVWMSFLCRQLIVSFSYYGGEVETFRNMVRWGHKLGWIMKVATINDENLANRFWNIGADLINTDVLINY